MKKTTFEEVKQARRYFYESLFGYLCLAIFIHFIGPQFQDSDLLRTVLGLLFFGSLASVAWSMQEPFKRYLAVLYRWKYGHAGPAILHTTELYVVRITRFFSGLAWIGIASSFLFALFVLSKQPLGSFLIGLQPVFQYSAVASLILFFIYPLLAMSIIAEAYSLWIAIGDQVQIAGLEEKKEEDAYEEQYGVNKPAIEITGANRFRAGNYEWSWSDFFTNTVILGQPGSGKTACVLNALLDGLLGSANEAQLPAAGLILDPKGDFLDKIHILSRKYGRTGDLLIIDPQNLSASIRWNPLDSSDDSMEIAERFAAVMQTLRPSAKNDAYWVESSKRLVENLIALIRCARPDSPPSLGEIYQAAMSDGVLERWGRQITQESKQAIRAIDYLQEVWMPLPDNTKATVRSFVSNMLGAFLVEPYDELFSGSSTIKVGEAVEQGKILYVHLPIAEKEVMSRVVSTFIKLEFYREILRRRKKQRPSFFLCDEFQSYFTVTEGRGDADAFERTRESRHANIVAFQNINSLNKQTEKQTPVHNLLANCAIKIFLRNTDKETNEYASVMFGEQIETLLASSVSFSGWLGGRSHGRRSTSETPQYKRRIKPEEFAKLAVPSQKDGIIFAESICYLGARSDPSYKKLKWKVHPIE